MKDHPFLKPNRPVIIRDDSGLGLAPAIRHKLNMLDAAGDPRRVVRLSMFGADVEITRGQYVVNAVATAPGSVSSVVVGVLVDSSSPKVLVLSNKKLRVVDAPKQIAAKAKLAAEENNTAPLYTRRGEYQWYDAYRASGATPFWLHKDGSCSYVSLFKVPGSYDSATNRSKYVLAEVGAPTVDLAQADLPVCELVSLAEATEGGVPGLSLVAGHRDATTKAHQFARFRLPNVGAVSRAWATQPEYPTVWGNPDANDAGRNPYSPTVVLDGKVGVLRYRSAVLPDASNNSSIVVDNGDGTTSTIVFAVSDGGLARLPDWMWRGVGYFDYAVNKDNSMWGSQVFATLIDQVKDAPAQLPTPVEVMETDGTYTTSQDYRTFPNVVVANRVVSAIGVPLDAVLRSRGTWDMYWSGGAKTPPGQPLSTVMTSEARATLGNAAALAPVTANSMLNYSPTSMVGLPHDVVVMYPAHSLDLLYRYGAPPLVTAVNADDGFLAIVVAGAVKYAGFGMCAAASYLDGEAYLVVCGSFTFPTSATRTVVLNLDTGEEYFLDDKKTYAWHGAYHRST